MNELQENDKYIETNIGLFDISSPSDEFQCKEKPEVMWDNEDTKIIKACLTRVICVMEDGTEQVIEPIVMASCMNPAIVNITPITYAENAGFVQVSTPYQTIDMTDERIKTIRTEPFEPVLKKHSCLPCRNCGRC